MFCLCYCLTFFYFERCALHYKIISEISQPIILTSGITRNREVCHQHRQKQLANASVFILSVCLSFLTTMHFIRRPKTIVFVRNQRAEKCVETNGVPESTCKQIYRNSALEALCVCCTHERCSHSAACTCNTPNRFPNMVKGNEA